MNKKRELVNTILDRIEEANVKLPESVDFALDAGYKLGCADPDRYWRNYPDGHCRRDATCIEQQLACLDEHSLEDILATGDIPAGIEWEALWRMWGAAGCFKCVPTILEDSEHTPILRIRHDSYLSWFRGYGFQNSYDAYDNGSNGSSGTDLKQAQACIMCPASDSDEEMEAWNREHAFFRKAMMLAFPMSAAGHQQYFHKLLQQYPEVFEEFFNRTDANKLQMDLDTTLTLDAMKKQAAETDFVGPTVLEMALVREDSKCTVLRYSEQCVSVSWSEKGEHKQLAIQFPQWDKEAYMDALDAIRDLGCGLYPPYPSMQNYLHCCWIKLTSALLTFAGVQASPYYWAPVKELATKMDSVPASIFSPDNRAEGLDGVWSALYVVSKSYPGFKELSAEYLGR